MLFCSVERLFCLESRVFMSLPCVSVFGVNVSVKDIDETVEYLFGAAKEARLPVVREDLNAFKVCLMGKDGQVARALSDADIVNADGMSIVFAIRFLCGKDVPRVTGCDLFSRLVSECHVRRNTIFLLGATEDTVQRLYSQLSEQFSPQLVAGRRNGYFSPAHWDEIIAEINESKANFVFVGTPSPQKEAFLNYARARVSAGVVLMGVGGSFDVLAGKVQRAPEWMQRAGLEWLFRIIQEPGRMWKRYLTTNSKFLLLLFKEKFKLLFI